MRLTREIWTEDGTGKLRVTLEKNFGSTSVGSITCLEFREAYAFRVTSVVRNELTENAWEAGTCQRGNAKSSRESAIIKRNHVISNPGMKACAKVKHAGIFFALSKNVTNVWRSLDTSNS